MDTPVLVSRSRSFTFSSTSHNTGRREYFNNGYESKNKSNNIEQSSNEQQYRVFIIGDKTKQKKIMNFFRFYSFQIFIVVLFFLSIKIPAWFFLCSLYDRYIFFFYLSPFFYFLFIHQFTVPGLLVPRGCCCFVPDRRHRHHVSSHHHLFQ